LNLAALDVGRYIEISIHLYQNYCTMPGNTRPNADRVGLHWPTSVGLPGKIQYNPSVLFEPLAQK